MVKVKGLNIPITIPDVDTSTTGTKITIDNGKITKVEQATTEDIIPTEDRQFVDSNSQPITIADVKADSEIAAAITDTHAAHSDDQDLSGKVDKVTGSSLVADSEITKIHALHADDQDLSGKQDVLISGSNIRTVNGNTLLGSTDIVIGGTFEGTMDDIPDGLTYVKTTNDFTDTDVSDLNSVVSLAHSNSLDHSNILDHTQGTDQGLDTGGTNAVTAAEAKAGYTHSGTPHAPSNAQPNNISDVNATDLTDGGATTLHKHSYNNLDNLPSIPSQYTDELAQDAVGGMIVDTTTINLTYTDSTPEFKADVIVQMSITSDASGIKLSGDTTTPGNNKVYGTTGAGVKGWKDDPTGTGSSPIAWGKYF
jgi:hypothetical protein